MDTLNRYQKKWGLSQTKLLAQTTTGHIYKVDDKSTPAILKLLTPLGHKSEANSGHILKCLAGKGSVKVLKFDEGALLLEFIEGPNLTTLAENHQDLMATEIICDVLKKIHSYSGPIPQNISDLQSRFKSLFDRAKLNDTPEVFIRTAAVANELIKTETSKVLLHGDIHHANILKTSDRGWVAIDPQPLYGERTYDVANCFFNPNNMPRVVENRNRIKSIASIFAARLNIDEKRILKFAYAQGGLSSSWQIDDGEDYKRRLRITKLIGQLLY